MIPQLKEKIAGEITMADEPGETIRKWRNMFDILQTELAERMDISSSVISDYEQGRRNPGTPLVRKIVGQLIEIDKMRGGDVVARFSLPGQEGIIEMEEFSQSTSISKLSQAIEGEILNDIEDEREIYGYTVIDSLKAILSMRAFDYLRIYGWSTQRILFFKGVEHGRSPLVAIRASPLTPAAVGYIDPQRVDPLSIKLADLEGIPLIKTDLTLKPLVKRLEEIQKRM